MKHHAENDDNMLSIRQKVLDPKTAAMAWQYVHFGIPLHEVRDLCQKTKHVVIDMTNKTLQYEKSSEESTDLDTVEFDEMEAVVNDPNMDPTDEELLQTIRDTYNVIEQQGRGRDFLSVLNAISRRTLSAANITVQLFLDIGSFLSVERVSCVRYNPLTMNFWSTVYKLFKGKALRFFRGYMAGTGNTGDDGKRSAANVLPKSQLDEALWYHIRVFSFAADENIR